MFKIEVLKLVSVNNEEFSYKFTSGINYFQGKNDTGKTVFYNFLDYMFGASNEIGKEGCLYNLDFAELKFFYRDRSFTLKRTMHSNLNYIKYSEKSWGKEISLNEYKEKLNLIFMLDENRLKVLRNFTEEDLTYRTFTLFNFLGEKSLGNIQDFFDKCSDFKYSIKLTTILNFLFNENLEKIFLLESEIKKLKDELSDLEELTYTYKLNERNINSNLKRLDAKIAYNGQNADEVLEYLIELKNLDETKKTKNSRTISELESIYHSLSEQIRVYENRIKDTRQFQIENENKLMLIEKLNSLISNQKEYSYLITPIQNILKDINTNISFNKYYIKDGTINKLKEEKNKIKEEIKTNDSRFSAYSLDKKSFIIALIEENLDKNIIDKTKDIENKKNEIKELRENLLLLKNKDNKDKIDALSNFITSLYLSAKDESEVVSRDEKLNVSIKYNKKGNILQPIIIYEEEEKIKEENYYIGSNARHTLIQLCGYLGFMRLLIIEKGYPIIPFLVLDHISKPFDIVNGRAVGEIFNTFYKNLPKDMMQIIMFDDKSPESLSIKPDTYQSLVTDKKSGFNPFFYINSIKN
ncbi:AAA family ATPase [Aliarcobacter butzleri]|uniref:AAA family ATPase n=1 Tax=Aliarcobacter butzleri TaxID=28197 RepID=UPI00263D20D6|nr:AAA family ATPase [Aliarcobacter butzleri]MDN5093535.1 hypothetical protein [Aliarcobacter butzleri]